PAHSRVRARAGHARLHARARETVLLLWSGHAHARARGAAAQVDSWPRAGAASSAWPRLPGWPANSLRAYHRVRSETVLVPRSGVERSLVFLDRGSLGHRRPLPRAPAARRPSARRLATAR